MATDNFNLDEIALSRRAAIKETIHPISIDDLKALGESLFPSVDHPWREKFLTFLAENPGGNFYHAVTDDRIHIIYCHPQDKGIWFLPGSGVGPLQAKGLHVLKEIVGSAH
jgi:hypothetical protein